MDAAELEREAVLRREMLARRDSLPHAEILLRSRIILVKLDVLPLFARGAVVHCYLPAGSEVHTLEFIGNLLARGRRVVVPVETREGLAHSELASIDGLKLSARGRLEPGPETVRSVKPSELSVAIVPGALFGRDGSRVGYADAAYDAFLCELACPLIAPAYDFQISSRLEHAPGRSRVDLVLAETVQYGQLRH